MLLADLDLPTYDHVTGLTGEPFHAALAELAASSWIAAGASGYAVLDRESANLVLRDRRTTFPALELLAMQGISSGPIYDRTVEGLMVASGPAHARLRRQLAPAFTPRAAERLRPRLQALVRGLWDPVNERGSCEFVTTLAEPLPSLAIAELLAVPGDELLLAHWSLVLQEVFKFRLDQTGPAVEAAYDEVRAYVVAKVAQRRAEPGEDLISVLATADELTDAEITTLICSVISGGTDTTQAQLAHAMKLFAEHPDQWALLCARPELVDRAVEEVLRFEPITPFTARLVTETMVVKGVTIPAGTVLFVSAATANRDPAAFEDPDVFDIAKERGAAAPLTFGFGAHFCVGAYLARAELAETLRYLSQRVRHLRLDGDPVLGPTTGIYAVEHLPLAWTPA